MSEFVSRRCRECGVGKVRLSARPGRKARFRTLNLTVPSDFELPTCDNCGAEWLNEEFASKLDSVLEMQYREDLSSRVKSALEKVVVATSQRDLERLLGLSHGYLSKLRSGDRAPSPDLVAVLTLLANDVSRIDEVKALWGAPDTSTKPLGGNPVLPPDLSQYLWNGPGISMSRPPANTGPTTGRQNTPTKVAA